MTATMPQIVMMELRIIWMTAGKLFLLPLQPAASMTDAGALLLHTSPVALDPPAVEPLVVLELSVFEPPTSAPSLFVAWIVGVKSASDRKIVIIKVIMVKRDFLMVEMVFMYLL